MQRLPRGLPDALAAALLALAVYAWFGHSFLNYDTFYALEWGRELARGRLPDYGVPVAPTPHPLAVMLGVLASPLGDRAEGALLALVLLALGALAVAVFRLGEALYAWPVGLLAALLVLTRVPILNFGVRGYVDLPALALVVSAAVLEARRRRRGAPVLALLAVAGLLRPEAWLYAAAYWAWVAPDRSWPQRARLGALAAAGPLAWCLMDLIVTGDPLWSLRGTTELAAELERRTGLGALPGVVPFRLGEILRLPELLLAVVGFGLGLWQFRSRTALPVAIGALNGLAFAVFALAGLPLLGRYLFLAAIMLALLTAVAVLGWTALEGTSSWRPRWRVAGVVALTALMVFAPVQARRLDALRDDIAARDRIQADLHDLVRTPRAEELLAACGPLFVPNHRPVPSLAYWTDRRPAAIVSAQLRMPSADGLFLGPTTREVEELSILDPRDAGPLTAAVPPSYRLVTGNRSWRLYAGCGR